MGNTIGQNKILKQVAFTAELYGGKLHSSKFTTREIQLVVHTPKKSQTEPRNDGLYNSLKTMPFIDNYCKISYEFTKVGTDFVRYKIICVVKKEFWDWGVTGHSTSAKFFRFCEKHSITTVRHLVEQTLPMIQNMNRYCHITDDKEIKKRYRGIKKGYIRFLLNHGFIQSIHRHNSYCDDMLLLFRVTDGISFHMRAWDVDKPSYNTFPCERSTEYPMLENDYQKHTYNLEDIQMDFKKHMFILMNINDRKKISLYLDY